MIDFGVDIREGELFNLDKDPENGILAILLKDRTTGNNILWGTDDYCHSENDSQNDSQYVHDAQIRIELITAENDGIIKPRALKSRDAQKNRSKDKAEVFTPAWICNAQNNLVDEAWFGYKNPFNAPNSSKKNPHEYTLAPLKKNDPEQKVRFPEGKTWQEYILLNRMEVSCGEAPYLVNRYDCDNYRVRIRKKVKMRIGLLDRKMRVICENATSKDEWLAFTKLAYQHIYGFEWQGDNLLLARENLLLSLFDYYQYQFGQGEMPPMDFVKEIAHIISWNLWQMDGITLQLIYSPKKKYEKETLFDDSNDSFCKIMDWDENTTIHFASLVKNK